MPLIRVESRNCVKTALGVGDHSKIIVIKVGTSSLMRPEHNALNLSALARICETVKVLHEEGHHVILVSSGAVGVGCQRLGLATRPTKLAQKQALAAVGQVHLMRFYEDLFQALSLVLLTLENLAQRDQYLNARNTFTELLNYGAVPVVNENDTVAVHQLRFGDNDTLSAKVATLVQADLLFLLTDVDCLYTCNPKDNPDAVPIHEVQDISALTADTSTRGTQWGTGGMATKLTAARIATAAGCTMVICNSSAPENIVRILHGERIGTRFHARQHVPKGRKLWVLSVPVRGSLLLDDGAVRAVKDRHKSLFAAGIVRVEGEFQAQDAVSLCDARGDEFARGLCSFSAEDVCKIRGRSSEHHASSLGYQAPAEVVHRGNLVLLAGSNQDSSESEMSHPASPTHGGPAGCLCAVPEFSELVPSPPTPTLPSTEAAQAAEAQAADHLAVAFRSDVGLA